jgi:hypothetical protein
MRHLIATILFLLSVVILTSCHQEENDVFATALVTVSAGEETIISQVQAQARLTNVNTRQVSSSADFNGATLQVELLRGAYQINIEGVVTYQDAAGIVRMRQFRAQTDYVELQQKGVNATTLTVIFLD